jgi:hypothetical protein
MEMSTVDSPPGTAKGIACVPLALSCNSWLFLTGTTFSTSHYSRVAVQVVLCQRFRISESRTALVAHGQCLFFRHVLSRHSSWYARLFSIEFSVILPERLVTTRGFRRTGLGTGLRLFFSHISKAEGTATSMSNQGPTACELGGQAVHSGVGRSCY